MQMYRQVLSLPLAISLLFVAAMPAMAAEQVLTLEQSVSYALSHNRSLAAATQRLEGALAQADEAGGAAMPRVDLSTGFYRTNSALNVFGAKVLQQQTVAADFDVNTINNPSYFNNYQTRLGLSLPLFAGGALQAASQQAEYRALAQQQQLAFEQQQIMFQTITAYVQAHQAAAQVMAQENAVVAAQKRFDNVLALKKRGMAIESDVMDADVYVLRAQVALDEARAGRESSLEALKLTLGKSPDQDLGALQSPSIRFHHLSLVDLLAEATTNRLDVSAMDAAAQAAVAAQHQSESGLWPHVNLVAAQEWNSNTLGLDHSNQMLGLVVSMNLYAGGADAAKVRQATVERTALGFQIEDARHQVNNEVRQAYRSLITAEKRLQSETKAESQTAESLRIKSLRHQQGLEKTSDVLDAQVRADTATIALIRAKYDLIIAKAALLLASGTLSQGVVQ